MADSQRYPLKIFVGSRMNESSFFFSQKIIIVWPIVQDLCYWDKEENLNMFLDDIFLIVTQIEAYKVLCGSDISLF